uniref:BLOC-1-related complex subunit 7 n=1 Tax=Mus spicilegus TaxID=10103 RepID=A0A8C6IKE3_MUSSI
MATGTPDSQARFGQSVKGLLTEKVNTCGTDVIALTKQVLKGSRSSEARSYSEEVSGPQRWWVGPTEACWERLLGSGSMKKWLPYL